MLPGRPLEPWVELQIDISKIDTPSLSSNKYVILVADQASKCPLVVPDLRRTSGDPL